MNFIQHETEQKLRGGFYTAAPIAAFLARWVGGCSPRSVLEPSCGDGAFLEALDGAGIASLERVTACEIDAQEAEKARHRTNLPVDLLHTDFLRWYLFEARGREGFDAIVGNPPFIRYQYLAEEQQNLAAKMFSLLGLAFTKHTNAWVPFVLASVNLLRPGGRIAMVVPSEILHIPHAESLRQYLSAQCSRIVLFDPEEIWFDDTLQGTVLLLAEKKRQRSEKTVGIAVQPVRNQLLLQEDPEDCFERASFTNGEATRGKWMPLLLSAKERQVLFTVRQDPAIRVFRDIASVDVGIVTGANKFFLVPDSIVAEFDLAAWAHPMFGRSEHVRGLVFAKEDHEANKRAGLPANFLWFQEECLESLPANVRQYLDLGESQDLPSRFKCRSRRPWYKVPSVHTAPVAMLKRAHHYPRLVLNLAQAYTTDTAYRITPLGVDATSLVFSFVNSLTCLAAEMEGRHYGGGVLELVPSEIERLLVPLVPASASDLSSADARFRSTSDAPALVRAQDALILGPMGLGKDVQDALHSAWLRLRDRRQRTTAAEPGVEEPAA